MAITNTYQQYLKESSRTFKVADHMLSVTYPLVKDTKLLLVVLENLHFSLTNAVSALVYHERYYKRLPPFQEAFDSQFNMFMMKCAPNYRIENSQIQLVQDIQSLICEHKKSPVEFIKQDKFVICSDDYKINALTMEEIKSYLLKTKIFIDNIQNIITKNERSTP
ncbi:MAG: hypothetical protein WC471_00205 [Candidatus Woesearchaeota archaeon]